MSSSTPNRRSATDPSRTTRIDLYDYCQTSEAQPRGRPVKDDLSDWRVVDDWPDDVPVTPEEVDVFEAWFGDILEELFGSKEGIRLDCVII